MKTMILVAAALFATSVFAQVQGQGTTLTMPPSTGTTHMLEFNADSVLQSILGFEKSKTKGSSTNTDTQLKLDVGYAHSLMTMPQLQIGGRLNYNKGTGAGRGDFEDYGAQIGAILNHTADLQNALYASLYLGYGIANTYGGGGDFTRKDETLTWTAAVGKRFSMEGWGIKHLTYTPEIAFQSINSTTGSALEYSQSLQFRILQFSVFF